MKRVQPVAREGQSVHERTDAAEQVSLSPLPQTPRSVAEHQCSWFVAPSGELWRVEYYRTEYRFSGSIAFPLVSWWIATRDWDGGRTFLFPAPVGIEYASHDLWWLFDQAWRAHVFGDVEAAA
ncbi:hypothetical protein [Vreelandella utahensis]|uniref:hypothetical protein n=1 Tax=Vreelandella halophila TaxID=86177 RepID=UPI00098792D2|nr:hypothetical protein [Halomonas utahensis]